MKASTKENKATKNCFIFHNYEKYGELKDCHGGYKKMQARECKNCGVIQIRTVRLTDQCSASKLNESVIEGKEKDGK